MVVVVDDQNRDFGALGSKYVSLIKRRKKMALGLSGVSRDLDWND
jgi:hypothetical protein